MGTSWDGAMNKDIDTELLLKQRAQRVFEEGQVVAYSDDFTDKTLIGTISAVITKPHLFYVIDESLIAQWRIIDVVTKRNRRKLKGL